MIDIHCHILPGLDDGSTSMEESVQMAEMAIKDGITHVVGTPHSNNEYKFDTALIRQRKEELQAAVGDRLKLATGCDFHLSIENLTAIEKDTARFTINQKNYLLVEFADFALPPGIEDTLLRLQMMGLALVITHPERNRLICAQPDRLRKWLHQGCYVQITAQSLTGRWGEGVQKQAEKWVDQEMVHFFASDAHNLTKRPLQLRSAYEMVAERWGPERAQALFVENPLAAFEGRPLPYEPEQPDPKAKLAQPKKRKRFIFF